MSKVSQRVRCKLCGGKNDADAQRCAHCTRPLQTDPMPSHALHDEAMWSQPVSGGSLRPTLSPAGVGLFVIFAAFFVNYMWIGYGPEWLSRPDQAPLASEWRAQSGDGYRIDLPGTPITGPSTDGQLSTMSVWLDNRWNLLVDANTQAKGTIRDAETLVYAIPVSGSGTAPADIEASAAPIVESLLETTNLDETNIGDAVKADDGSTTVDMTATFTGGFNEDAHGEVSARLVTVDGRVYVAATFYRDGVNPALHEKLISEFTPTAIDPLLVEDADSN